MKKEQFITTFEAQVQLEIDKMNVAGDAPEAFHCAAVAQLFFEYLKEDEFGLLDFEPCSYFAEASPGQGEISINGYYLSDDASELHLFSVVKADAVGAKVSRSDVKSAIDKAFRFYKRAGAKTAKPFHDELDEALTPHVAARSIHAARSSICVVRVYVFTDGECEGISVYPEETEGLMFAPQFWDIERLHKQMTSGFEREEIVIDFKQEHRESLPAMKMIEPNGGYICYVGFISGTVLAEMYSKHSSRLIEQNVRMYLQARGKVNSGIQATIKDSPEGSLPITTVCL